MSKETDMSYLELLQEATDERDQLFEFVNQQVSDLISPLVDGLNQYLSLPRGYIEITSCTVDEDTVVMVGSIFTQVGDHIADAYFGVPTKVLGDGHEPPPIDQLVQFMEEVDSKREVRQKDSIIQLIAEAELKLYHDATATTNAVPTITEMHVATQGETLTEYNHRNLNTSQRTVH